jgi:hypothetical protein
LIAAGVAAALLAGGAVHASSPGITFESPTFHAGSIDGQNGWAGTSGGAINTSIDQGIVLNGVGAPASFGTQSWRLSNAYTNGSFGDWPFSPSLPNEAGETNAHNDGLSGGTRVNHFEAQWDFASAVPNAEQPGLQISISPDRGDGARMSFVRLKDNPSGLSVEFDDYQDAPPYGSIANPAAGCGDEDNFVLTTVASGLSRALPHTIKLTMDFVEGPHNDVVKVYVDGALVHTGTSWEDYSRWCAETDESSTVDSLIFQARSGGGTAPATLGHGFLIDNVTLSSANVPSVTINPATIQYSDQATVSVNVGGLSSGGFSTGGTVTLKSGTTTLGTKSLTNANQASLNFAVPVSIGLAPGSYDLAATFAPSDTTHFQPGSGSLSHGLTVSPEDARVSYTGPTLVSTASPTSTSASFDLNAVVRDISAVPGDPATDAFPGDIRTATLTFVDRGNANATLCTATLNLVAAGDQRIAAATCPSTVNLGTQSTRTLSVGIVVGGNYTRNNSADNVTVQVSKAHAGGSATASGTVTTSQTAGQLAGGGSSVIGLQASVAYTAGAAHPTGLVNLTISTGGHLYVLTSTSVDQFTGSGGKATIQATGVLTDLTNLLHPHVLDTQASVQLSLKAGPGPTAAVALQRSDGTIAFVAGWNGTTLIPLPLSSGMINIS